MKKIFIVGWFLVGLQLSFGQVKSLSKSDIKLVFKEETFKIKDTTYFKNYQTNVYFRDGKAYYMKQYLDEKFIAKEINVECQLREEEIQLLQKT